MILPDNKHYEVWDKFNSRNIALSDPEPIPGFNIKKELIGSSQAKLYDNIRREFYDTDKDKPPYTEIELENAVYEYDELVDEIYDYIINIAQEEHDSIYYINEIKFDTIDYYKDEIEYLSNEENIDTHKINAYNDFIKEIEDYYDEDDLRSVENEFQKKYPNYDIELKGDFYFKSNIVPDVDLNDHPNYLKVLNAQYELNGRTNFINKANEKIKYYIYDTAYDVANEFQTVTKSDVSNFLDDIEVIHPEYSDELY
jgi:hypothetical protein